MLFMLCAEITDSFIESFFPTPPGIIDSEDDDYGNYSNFLQ